MNILELQLGVVVSGVPESGSGQTLLDTSTPAFERRSLVPPDRSASPDATEPDPVWLDLTYHQL